MIDKKDSEVSKKDKIELELERQTFLYSYWSDAQKLNLSIIGFFASIIIIPQLLHTSLDFNNWRDWILVTSILVLVLIFVLRDRHYDKKQSESKNLIESLKI